MTVRDATPAELCERLRALLTYMDRGDYLVSQEDLAAIREAALAIEDLSRRLIASEEKLKRAEEALEKGRDEIVLAIDALRMMSASCHNTNEAFIILDDALKHVPKASLSSPTDKD